MKWPLVSRKRYESDLRNAKQALAIARGEYEAEKRSHESTRIDLRDRKAFIAERLAALTDLAPTKRFAVMSAMPRYIEPAEIAREIAAEIFEGRRRDIIVRVALPPVYEFWAYQKDYAAMDLALRYIAESVAHHVEKAFRFGLTGQREVARG